MKLDKKVVASVLNGRELTRDAEEQAGELAEHVVALVAAVAVHTKTQATLSEAHILQALESLGVHTPELQNHMLQHKHRGYTHTPTW
jgi:hypothetical protein